MRSDPIQSCQLSWLLSSRYSQTLAVESRREAVLHQVQLTGKSLISPKIWVNHVSVCFQAFYCSSIVPDGSISCQPTRPISDVKDWNRLSKKWMTSIAGTLQHENRVEYHSKWMRAMEVIPLAKFCSTKPLGYHFKRLRRLWRYPRVARFLSGLFQILLLHYGWNSYVGAGLYRRSEEQAVSN